MNKAFAKSFQRDLGGQADGKAADIPYAMLKGARHSGQLNLSNRQLEEVPIKVWRVNIDVPDEAKGVTLTDTDERWWDQVDMRKLILASNQLRSIPDDVQHLPALTVLDAHDNQIETISERIGDLGELFKLHLSHNKITSFPPTFCNLTQLKSLLLTSNAIQHLPDNFGLLVNIEELQLADNKLTTLPESFGKLQKLQKLNLSKNRLECFPSSFSELTSLSDLDASSNKLLSLPEGFDRLTSLTILECRNNQIAKFSAFNEPASIQQLFLGNNRIAEFDDDVFTKLPKLVSLDLRDNRISVLNDSICALNSLERIDLSNNFLSALPYVMGNMSLKSLSLDGNPLRGIRRDIVSHGTQHVLAYLKSRIPVAEPSSNEVPKTQSQNQEVICINNNNNDVVPASNDQEPTKEGDNTVIPEHISPIIKEPSRKVIDQYLVATTKVLTHSASSLVVPDTVWLAGAKITKVDFSKNALTEFPLKLADYADTLSELDLSKNKIPSLPGLAGSLAKLTFIDVSNNLLSSLPDEIVQLLHLLQITLTYNRFKEIPAQLFTLPKLQTILIANNQIIEINVPGLLTLKTLQCLDLANNNIARVPPELGNVDWLKSLTLDGNCFRNPRPQIMTQGTQFILSYLRDRIPS